MHIVLGDFFVGSPIGASIRYYRRKVRPVYTKRGGFISEEENQNHGGKRKQTFVPIAGVRGGGIDARGYVQMEAGDEEQEKSKMKAEVESFR